MSTGNDKGAASTVPTPAPGSHVAIEKIGGRSTFEDHQSSAATREGFICDGIIKDLTTLREPSGASLPQTTLSGPHAGPPERTVHSLSETSGEKGMGASPSISNSRFLPGGVCTAPEDDLEKSE